MEPSEEAEAPDVVRSRDREAAAIEPFADWTADLQPSADAMERFFGSFLEEEPDDDEVDAFAEFVLFDYADGESDDARTLVREYLDEHETPDEEHRKILEGLSDSRPSLYRIVECKAGVGVVLEDLFRHGEAVFLTDALFAATSAPGMVVACRLYRVDTHVFGRPAGTALEADEAVGALAWLERRFCRWAAVTHCVDRDDFLRRHPELVTQATYAVTRGMGAAPPEDRIALADPLREP
jgi:hypothetical protein